MREFKGWSIDRAPGTGYWRGWKAGELPLMADTLAGLRELINHPADVEAARKRIYG